MRPGRREMFAIALAAALAAGAAAGASEGTRVLGLATGDASGAYFPAGIALCRVVNVDRPTHGLRCAALLSEGSVANLDALRAGEVELALAQSDAQDAAWRGADAFAGEGPFEGLRSVASLFPEPLTLIAAEGAGIAGLGDLLGKRVNLGPAGSGQRAMVEALMGRLGWRNSAFADAGALPTAEAVAALCEGRMDAIFLAIAHPALAVQEATAACGGALVPVEGPQVAALVAANPFYFATEIPGGLYAGAPDPAPSFGVAATLVTREDLPAGVVETVLGAILDALAPLAGFEPVLAALDPEAMPRRGLTAPLHPGAEAVYRARGLIE